MALAAASCRETIAACRAQLKLKCSCPPGRGLLRKEPIRTVAGGLEMPAQTGCSTLHSLTPVLARTDFAPHQRPCYCIESGPPWRDCNDLPTSPRRCPASNRLPCENPFRKGASLLPLTARHSGACSTWVVFRQSKSKLLGSRLQLSRSFAFEDEALLSFVRQICGNLRWCSLNQCKRIAGEFVGVVLGCATGLCRVRFDGNALEGGWWL